MVIFHSYVSLPEGIWSFQCWPHRLQIRPSSHDSPGRSSGSPRRSAAAWDPGRWGLREAGRASWCCGHRQEPGLPRPLRRAEPKSRWTYLDPKKLYLPYIYVNKKTILMRIAYLRHIYIYVCVCIRILCIHAHPKPWKPSARPRTHHLPPGSSEYTPLPVVPCLPHRWPAPGHGVQLRPGASLGRWPPRSAAWVESSGIAPWCPDVSWPLLEACRIWDGSKFENSSL